MSDKVIFVVEDDASIRQLYECTFESNDFSVLCFETAEEMFDALHKKTPSIIIMDLMLPKMDGITAINILKGDPATSLISVIIISANGAETVKVKGLNIGADDYIEKPFGVLELVARVKRIFKRLQDTNFNKDVISYKDLEINLRKHSVTVSGKKVELTPKEFDILYLLVNMQGEVVKRDKIFDTVWGENFFTETRTLDIHIKSLRKKLKEVSGEEYINTVRGVGYTIE